MQHNRFYSKSASPAFTLVELLLVMAIMTMMMTLVIPVTSSMLESNGLGRGAQILSDQIRLARQLASSQNRTVEVRLMQLKPDGKFYNDSTLPASGLNAVQLWAPNPAGGKAIGRVIPFPGGVAISTDKYNVSELFGHIPTGNLPITSSTTNAFYASVPIRPTGLVAAGNLGMTTSYLTVVPSRQAGIVDFSQIHNYVTVQINPVTGATLLFKP